MHFDLLKDCVVLSPRDYKALLRPKLPGIYALADVTEPHVVRYIGSSSHIPKRYNDHLRAKVKRARDGVKASWVEELRAAGRYPIAYILERVEADSASPLMHAMERKWLEVFRAIGQSDLNRTLTSNAGELEYLREQVKKLTKENARLTAKLMQLQLQCNSCIS